MNGLRYTALVLALFVSGCGARTEPEVEVEEGGGEPSSVCEAGGGVIRDAPDSCVAEEWACLDSRRPNACTPAFVPDQCYCGEDACWSGTACLPPDAGFKERCEAGGGSIRAAVNSCVADEWSCIEPRWCTPAEVPNQCYCGEDKCWAGGECV